MQKLVCGALLLGSVCGVAEENSASPSSEIISLFNEPGIFYGEYDSISRPSENTLGMIIPTSSQHLVVVGEDLSVEEVESVRRVEREMYIDMIAFEAWQHDDSFNKGMIGKYEIPSLFEIDENNFAFEELKDIDFGDPVGEKPIENKESKDKIEFTFISKLENRNGLKSINSDEAELRFVPSPEELIAMNDLPSIRSPSTFFAEVQELLKADKRNSNNGSLIPVKEVLLYNLSVIEEKNGSFIEELVGDAQELVDINLAEFFVEKKWNELFSVEEKKGHEPKDLKTEFLFGYENKNLQSKKPYVLFTRKLNISNEQFALFVSSTGYHSSTFKVNGRVTALEDFKAYEAWLEKISLGRRTLFFGINLGFRL